MRWSKNIRTRELRLIRKGHTTLSKTMRKRIKAAIVIFPAPLQLFRYSPYRAIATKEFWGLGWVGEVRER